MDKLQTCPHKEAATMPMLPPEPNQYPENLFAGPHGFGSRVWWVLHTKPRQEKSLARQLHQAAVPFFLPLASRRLWIRSRETVSYAPLFPGYLFLFGNGEARLKALSTNRVATALTVPNQQRLWQD